MENDKEEEKDKVLDNNSLSQAILLKHETECPTILSRKSSIDVTKHRRSRYKTMLKENAPSSPLVKPNEDNDPYNCIIADDIDTNLFVLKAMLKGLNMNALTAKNGAECVNLVN